MSPREGLLREKGGLDLSIYIRWQRNIIFEKASEDSQAPHLVHITRCCPLSRPCTKSGSRMNGLLREMMSATSLSIMAFIVLMLSIPSTRASGFGLVASLILAAWPAKLA